MSLASLLNIPPASDQRAFEEFSFSNADQHLVVTRAIAAQKGISLPYYVIDPMPFFSMGVWLYTHQQWHNNINGVLGVAGLDFTSVDFSNYEQAASFIRLHFQEHLTWSQKLGTN
jgi:hypothetical protein